LELQLPEAPGAQVYKTAKQIDPDLNVIVITGYPDSEMLDRMSQGRELSFRNSAVCELAY
jgi:DNA-binding NarL/FixJ family response regulator